MHILFFWIHIYLCLLWCYKKWPISFEIDHYLIFSSLSCAWVNIHRDKVLKLPDFSIYLWYCTKHTNTAKICNNFLFKWEWNFEKDIKKHLYHQSNKHICLLFKRSLPYAWPCYRYTVSLHRCDDYRIRAYPYK